MNKKGLTLIELLAVIIILGVIALIITPGILAIRDSVVSNTYNNKVSLIENAAKDYAQDNIDLLPSPVANEYGGEKTRSEDCRVITVNTLLNSGYIATNNSYVTNSGSNGNQIINPITNESMNNKSICVRFDTNDAMNRVVIAYLIEED